MPIPLKNKVKNYDNTLAGLLINHVENPDSIGFINNVWYSPKYDKRYKPGVYDPANFGMGVDRNENEYAKTGELKFHKDKQGREYITVDEERNARHHLMEDAEQAYYRRLAHAQKVTKSKNTPSEMKKAITMSAIYNLGSKRVSDTLFEDKKLMETLMNGSDMDYSNEVNRYFRKFNKKDRDKHTNEFIENWQKQNNSKKQNVSATSDIEVPAFRYNDGFPWKAPQNYVPSKVTSDTYNDGMPALKSEGGQIEKRKLWDDLSIAEKSEMMKVAIQNGITSLKDIRSKYNEFAEGGPEEKDKSLADNIRERLYYNVVPRGYENAVPRLFDAVLDKRERRPDSPNLEALWAKYLGLNDEDFRSMYKDFPDDRLIQYPLYPHISDYVQESKYTPSEGKDKDAKYYSLAFPEISNWEIDQFLTSPDKRRQTQGYNDTMGTFTLTKGRDDKGDYISYYDKWDVSPFRGYGAKHDESLGIGKPVELYDRLYLDDYYNNLQSPADYWSKDDYYGGYLPEVIVTASGEPADEGLRGRVPTPDNIGLGTFGRQNPVN